ncbi:MAG: DM13 domain-containing protein [Candidatus Eisenbacteria bacterium]|uniref:DM13 domain-containing protein n=1 Tax=Eiseniibacteriota bacterium TaxID=2212470 RepID=A0A849STV8_UNCEI|nr:DM13 domain-containing protein [Candidatus Eisenbacteria bacterium]
MQSRNILVVLVLLAGGAIGWYLFRPERLFVNQKVSEALPAVAATATPASGAPETALMGRFHKGAHETKGVATIYQLQDGSRVLRLTEFETSNGPDVHVYLVAAMDALDNASVEKAGFVDLGSIKGNVGDQNYTLPADLDLSKYRAVTIWCARFKVNFGTAALETGDAMSAVSEAMPSSPRAALTGQFHKGTHDTHGMAGVYEVGGKKVLRLTEFATSNGPDVHVYLVAANDAMDNASVEKAGFIDLGSLKGNIGDQNYEIPTGTDLSKYRAVTIWCARFKVNFGTAPLAAQNS